MNILKEFGQSYLHYDLEFLKPGGGRWPSNGDELRQEVYEWQREQFELTPEDLVRQLLPDGLMRFGTFKDFAILTRFLAYPRLLTLKTVDMVLGQPPMIQAQADKEKTELIKDLRSASQLDDIFKQALIDYSRFGVFLIRIFKDNGRAKVCAWNPMQWTPVFYPDGTNRIHYNVIGWQYGSTLTLQIHDTEDGSYEERICTTDGSGYILSIDNVQFYNRNTGKKLLYAVTNTPTTTNPIGTSDYEIINGLLQKAIQRLQAILRVLDEHADPSMTGPHSLLDKDEHGELVFRTSRYYAVGDDEQKPEYLTWEANLDSSFKAFETLVEQIYIMSEMGDTFLGAHGSAGNVVSGTSMRLKMISPLEKARRITNALSRPLKEIVSTMLSIEKVDLEPKDINITWRDSLPKDPRETAELTRLEAGSPAVKPITQSLMDNYDLDLESAQQYVDKIYEEQERLSQLNSKQETKERKPDDDPSLAKKGSILDPASSENKTDAQRTRDMV